MKAAAEFGLDWLIDDGKGHLVTAPSTSPELSFRTPDGREASVSMASTMDMSIIWELFSDCLDALRVLGIEPEFAARLEAARAKLYPLKIGARGQLQEWFHDFVETEVAPSTPLPSLRRVPGPPDHRRDSRSFSPRRSAPSRSAATTAPAGRSAGRSTSGHASRTATTPTSW